MSVFIMVRFLRECLVLRYSKIRDAEIAKTTLRSRQKLVFAIFGTLKNAEQNLKVTAV